MFLPYWLVLALPLLAFPTVSHRHHSQLFEREKNALAADNAAIVLGERDRDWLNALDRANGQIEAWEKIHHAWHACRHFPLTTAKCTPPDVAWETAIRLRHAEAGAAAQFGWQRASAHAQSEIFRLEAKAVLLRRLPLAPVSPKLCPVCHLPNGWRIVAPVTSQVVNANALETLTVVAQKEEEGSDYGYAIQ